MVIPPPTRLGKYDIVRALGEGAMGVVYEAVDSVIERTVAIKTIRRGDLDADEAAEHGRRFLIEAKAAGKLNHPNIIGLYDHGNEAGLAYIVMELVQGRELQHWFDDGHAFALGDVLRLMGELLDALGYSHLRGVIHRDVKPSNIFVTEAGRIKLGDFGIARIESSQKTRIGAALGTPSHMAPEQIRGEGADARSDLYAAGVVLFQFLTGTRPFAGTMLSMAMKVLNHPAPAPSSLRPGISPQLDAVVAKALAKQADDRYQTAAEFWQALATAGGMDLGSQALSGFGASGFGASGFGTSGFGTTGFGTSGVGQSGAGTDQASLTGSGSGERRGWASSRPGPSDPGSKPGTRGLDETDATVSTIRPRRDIAAPARPEAQSKPTAPAQPSAGRRIPAVAWLAIGGLAVLLLAGLWWRQRPLPPAALPSPAPLEAPPPTTPASAATPLAAESAPRSAPASASVPDAASIPARVPALVPVPVPVPAPVPAQGPAPVAIPAPAAAPTPASASVLAPAPVPPPVAAPAPAPAPPPATRTAPVPAETARRAAREAPRPAPPRAVVNAPSTPQPKAPKPARCSDILQKASLEPLTGEEAAYLRRECQ